MNWSLTTIRKKHDIVVTKERVVKILGSTLNTKRLNCNLAKRNNDINKGKSFNFLMVIAITSAGLTSAGGRRLTSADRFGPPAE